MRRIEQRARLGASTGVLPFRVECFGPRMRRVDADHSVRHQPVERIRRAAKALLDGFGAEVFPCNSLTLRGEWTDCTFRRCADV